MKQVIFLTAGCILILNAFAPKFIREDGSQEWKSKYCAVMKDGEMAVMNGDVQLVVNIPLDNESVITTDGFLISKDGTKTALKEGQCVDKSGNVVAGKNKD